MSHLDQPHLPYVDPTVQRPVQHGPGCLRLGLWLLFAGWWLSLGATIVAWVLLVSGAGTAAGMRLLARLPRLAFLEQPSEEYLRDTAGVAAAIDAGDTAQPDLGLRLAYVVLVGWWLSGLALLVAWLLLISIAGIGASRWLYRRAPAIATLGRYELTAA